MSGRLAGLQRLTPTTLQATVGSSTREYQTSLSPPGDCGTWYKPTPWRGLPIQSRAYGKQAILGRLMKLRVTSSSTDRWVKSALKRLVNIILT